MWQEKDPLKAFRKKLQSEGRLNEDEDKRIQLDVQSRIDEATEYALASLEPDEQEAMQDVYSC